MVNTIIDNIKTSGCEINKSSVIIDVTRVSGYIVDRDKKILLVMILC